MKKIQYRIKTKRKSIEKNKQVNKPIDTKNVKINNNRNTNNQNIKANNTNNNNT